MWTKLQFKPPDLWFSWQRCVAEVRIPKMKEEELSRVLQLTNISLLHRKTSLLKCSQNWHSLLLFIFPLRNRKKTTHLTTKSTIKTMCMKNLIQENVIFLWIANTAPDHSDFQKLLSKIKFLCKGFCQSYRQ